MRPHLARLLATLLTSSALLLARQTDARPVPHLDHIIVVIMENKDYATALTGPYTQSLVAEASSLSGSYAIRHPSQPNYLALWAGSTLSVTNDNCPPFGSPYAAENLGHACEAAGLTWRAYSEDLPAAGYAGCTANSSLYTRKHDPWTNFNNLNHQNERPYTDLPTDIQAHALPNLAFVIPNNCDNSHDGGCNVLVGDNWLAANLPAMRQAVGPAGLVLLTWDEDDSNSLNHVLTVFAGDSAKAGFVSTRLLTHYTVLRTICDALGIAPFGNAASESPITDVWREIRTITATAEPGGAISPSGTVTLDAGADASFTITPDAHYHVADVQVDGASVGAVTSYTFTSVTADHTIDASFAIDTHALTIDVQGSGAVTRSPSLARYDYGSVVQLTAVPDPGWVFTGWSGDVAGAGSTTTLLIDGDKSVRATFALEITFDFKPHDLDLNAKGPPWVTGYLRPPAPYLASQIDVLSLRLNGAVSVSSAEPAKLEDHDSRLKVKFARSEVKPTLVPGENVPVTVTGMIAGQALIGVDDIKVKAPKLHTPRAGDQLVAGMSAAVTWDPPDGTTSVTVLSSLDNGITWNVEAPDVPNTGSYAWTVPAASTTVARLEVVAIYDEDETGIIPQSEFAASDAFSIQSSAGVDDASATFALRCLNPVIGPLAVHFSLAATAAATLAVYDVSGRLVCSRRITSGLGWHTMTLADLPSGIFLVRLSQGERSLSRRVAVIR